MNVRNEPVHDIVCVVQRGTSPESRWKRRVTVSKERVMTYLSVCSDALKCILRIHMYDIKRVQSESVIHLESRRFLAFIFGIFVN